MQGKWHNEQQSAHGDGQLKNIDDRGRCQAARRAVGDGYNSARQTSLPLGKAGGDVQNPGDGHKLAGENAQCATPKQDRDQAFYGFVIAELKVIAKSMQAVM